MVQTMSPTGDFQWAIKTIISFFLLTLKGHNKPICHILCLNVHKL